MNKYCIDKVEIYILLFSLNIYIYIKISLMRNILDLKIVI